MLMSSVSAEETRRPSDNGQPALGPHPELGSDLRCVEFAADQLRVRQPQDAAVSLRIEENGRPATKVVRQESKLTMARVEPRHAENHLSALRPVGLSNLLEAGCTERYTQRSNA